jgi:uncharacterized membrane protein
LPRERRLAGRLEGFGDIVFGFTVSQCALQLPIVSGHIDIGNPIALLLYFGTFAVIASLWLIYHRMLSGTFKPAGVDLALPFAYLALVSLIPYAMYEIAHNSDTQSARTSLFYYLAIYATMTSLSAVLTFRNMRRGYFYLDAGERDHAWLALLRQLVLCGMMSAAIVINAFAGPARAGLFLFLIIVAVRVARMLFPRAPSAARLRIQAPAAQA